MADGVFHDRLQNHMRHRGVENFGIRGDFHPQPVLKAHLFDGTDRAADIPVRGAAELPVPPRRPERSAADRSGGQHLLGLAALLLPHQHHDGVQRVEQKMRLELHLQRAQMRLHELAFELGGAKLEPQCFLFAFLIPAIPAVPHTEWRGGSSKSGCPGESRR